MEYKIILIMCRGKDHIPFIVQELFQLKENTHNVRGLYIEKNKSSSKNSTY